MLFLSRIVGLVCLLEILEHFLDMVVMVMNVFFHGVVENFVFTGARAREISTSYICKNNEKSLNVKRTYL